MTIAVSLTIAVVQLEPVLKQLSQSIARADALVNSINRSVDMIILPEMAFTGYCFTSLADITPFLECASTGPSFHWASSVARRHSAYVLLGFPELSPSDSKAYNSLLVVAPTGELLSVYRKHHLFTTDESWATAGPSFEFLDLPFSLPDDGEGKREMVEVRIAPCICMDLNPDPEGGEGVRYELGEFAKREKVQLVVCCMAWLDSGDEEEEGREVGGRERTEWERVRGTLGYWAARVSPLIGSGATFVACNRVGVEGETKFTGSSCAIRLDDPPFVTAHARKAGQEVLMLDIEIPNRPSQD